jgi:hypothetical protein
MKSNRLLGISFVVGSSLLVAPMARSQDLTVFVGGTMPGDLGHDAGKIRLESGPVWGARLSFGFAAYLGFEYTIAFSPDYLFPKDAVGIQDAKGVISNANLILNLPVPRVVPYATFGLGLIYQYGSPDLPVGAEFAVNYGGGLKIPRIWGPFGLRIDGRGYTVPSVLSTKLNIFELSGGVLISF